MFPNLNYPTIQPFTTQPSDEFNTLLRRKSLESRSNLLLPRHANLPIDLGTGLQVLSIVEQDGANDVLVISQESLVVVDVGGAVATVVAMNWLTRVTGVSVSLDVVLAFGDLQILLGDNLVQGIRSTTKSLAGITMAKNVRPLFKLDLPLHLAAMALCLIGRHDCRILIGRAFVIY